MMIEFICPSSCDLPQLVRSSNNRFERRRGSVFGEPRRESMIVINQLRFVMAHRRVAQPHR
jgi:hypothetical protein